MPRGVSPESSHVRADDQDTVALSGADAVRSPAQPHRGMELRRRAPARRDSHGLPRAARERQRLDHPQDPARSPRDRGPDRARDHGPVRSPQHREAARDVELRGPHDPRAPAPRPQSASPPQQDPGPRAALARSRDQVLPDPSQHRRRAPRRAARRSREPPRARLRPQRRQDLEPPRGPGADDLVRPALARVVLDRTLSRDRDRPRRRALAGVPRGRAARGDRHRLRAAPADSRLLTTRGAHGLGSPGVRAGGRRLRGGADGLRALHGALSLRPPRSAADLRRVPRGRRPEGARAARRAVARRPAGPRVGSVPRRRAARARDDARGDRGQLQGSAPAHGRSRPRAPSDGGQGSRRARVDLPARSPQARLRQPVHDPAPAPREPPRRGARGRARAHAAPGLGRAARAGDAVGGRQLGRRRRDQLGLVSPRRPDRRARVEPSSGRLADPGRDARPLRDPRRRGSGHQPRGRARAASAAAAAAARRARPARVRRDHAGPLGRARERDPGPRAAAAASAAARVHGSRRSECVAPERGDSRERRPPDPAARGPRPVGHSGPSPRRRLLRRPRRLRSRSRARRARRPSCAR